MNIYDVVDRQRAALIAREYQAVKNIVRAYEVAERRVVAEIRGFQAKISEAQVAGLTPSKSWYYQEARLENILREIRGHLDMFSADALEFSAAGRDDSYRLGAVHAVRLAEAQVYGDIAGLSAQAFANAQALLSATSPLKALFDTIGPTATTTARELFAEAIALGWNPRTLAARLTREMRGLAKERAILIARTEMIRSYRIANADVYRRNADVLRGWRWTSAKTPATCAMCLALDGEIYPVDKTLTSHPACRCTMVPLPKTDFGGPQPTSGEAYFQALTPKQQDKLLGRRKGAMYRCGTFTLKDNVRWHEDSVWGTQPRSRTVRELTARHAAGRLPSQQGIQTLSGHVAPAPRLIADILSIGDPVHAAIDAWNAAAGKVGLKVARRVPYTLPESLKGVASTVDEVTLDNLLAASSKASRVGVARYIRAHGDGPDLPVVVRSGAGLYIHGGDSLARLEAKRLLGQTKATVRLIDADALARRTPLDEITDTLTGMGVTEIIGSTPTDAYRLEALRWAKERFEATGVVPTRISFLGRATEPLLMHEGKTLVIGPSLADVTAPSVDRALRSSWLNDATERGLQSVKARAFRLSTSNAENLEAALYRSRMKTAVSANDIKLALSKHGLGYDLASMRTVALLNWEDAIEEAIIAYRRGTYRLGDLPDILEKEFLAQAADVIGNTPVLPAHDDAARVFFQQIGPQAGSNPGGLYMGRDGVRRYAKFYENEERARVEHLAATLYRAHGIDVPKTALIARDGKTAIVSDIVQGETIHALGGVDKLTGKQLETLFEGYMMDAFLANWDVLGASGDNIIVNAAMGRVYRIDNGGALIFRSQGGDKPEAALLMLEDFFSLGSQSSKGYTGQMKPVLSALGYRSIDEAVPQLLVQWDRLLSTLDGIGDWHAFIATHAPGLSRTSADRLVAMFTTRRRLLSDKLAELRSLKVKPKRAMRGKALTRQQIADITTAQPATWGIQGRGLYGVDEYDAWLRHHTDAAFDAMDDEARRALVDYSSGSDPYNNPLRAARKRGEALSPEARKRIQAMKRGIAANQKGLSADILLSRKLQGMHTDGKWHEFTEADVGTIVSDAAFQSTSMRPEVWQGDVHLRITLRKGERRWIPPARRANLGYHPDEVELILAPDILYVVQRVEKFGGQTVIYVEAIPEGFTVRKGTTIRYALQSLVSRFTREPLGAVARLKVGGTVHESGRIPPVTDLAHSLCAGCKLKHMRVGTCDAFHEGIPVDILLGVTDHRKAVQGDLGLVYEAKTEGEDMDVLRP